VPLVFERPVPQTGNIASKNKKEKPEMDTHRIVQVALGSAAITLTIMTIFNTAWAARTGNRYVAPITSFGDTDDGYVRGLEKLGIVKLPENMRRPSSSP